ncbi:hypothetical protein [Puia dinghuensis]|uniref:hypothetical protein n=1 Tax=Puia dinghuensis TaxID=1792502 RepID=UPI001665C562|nr:hypothetical protein [Puia dinghuensis]
MRPQDWLEDTVKLSATYSILPHGERLTTMSMTPLKAILLVDATPHLYEDIRKILVEARHKEFGKGFTEANVRNFRQ